MRKERAAQQRTRRATQLAESPPGRHATDDSTADASLHTPMPPLKSHSGKYTVRQTQTRVWTANVVAETATEAKRKAYRVQGDALLMVAHTFRPEGGRFSQTTETVSFPLYFSTVKYYDA